MPAFLNRTGWDRETKIVLFNIYLNILNIRTAEKLDSLWKKTGKQFLRAEANDCQALYVRAQAPTPGAKAPGRSRSFASFMTTVSFGWSSRGGRETPRCTNLARNDGGGRQDRGVKKVATTLE